MKGDLKMLEPRQIREVTVIKEGVKGRYRDEVAAFIEEAAKTVESLIEDNNSLKSEKLELSDKNEKMLELIDKHENEKNNLLELLTQARAELEAFAEREEKNARAVDYARAEADAIIERAKQRAGEIVQQAKNEQAAVLSRADALITQKALAFENELKADVARWRAADESLRIFKRQLTELAYKIPDGLEAGVNESAKALWRRLNNEIEEDRQLNDGQDTPQNEEENM